jgi:signal recognition particle GTPase
VVDKEVLQHLDQQYLYLQQVVVWDMLHQEMVDQVDQEVEQVMLQLVEQEHLDKEMMVDQLGYHLLNMDVMAEVVEKLLQELELIQDPLQVEMERIIVQLLDHNMEIMDILEVEVVELL